MKVYHQIWAILMLYPVFSGVCRGSEDEETPYVQYAELGDNVTLVCPGEIDPGDDELDNVKWHRGKYNQILDYSKSSQRLKIIGSASKYIVAEKPTQKISVLNVSKEYEGIYTCEITKYLNLNIPTIESFKIKLRLVELPRNPPIITGVRPRYIIGEEVKAECLSEVSKPQSTIEWWINDAAVSPDMVTNRTTSSTLRFNVSEHHLHGYEQDDLILKCSVKIKDGHKEVYWKTSVEEVKVSLPSSHPSIRGYLPAMFSGLASATPGPNLLTFLGLQCVILATTSFTVGAF